MIKLRTIVILVGVSGLCVALVLATSIVASRWPKSANLHADTRSLLTADYKSDPGPPAAPLSPIKPEIIESAGKDEALLAKTELRIGQTNGSAGGGSSGSNPRLDDFDTSRSSQANTTAAAATQTARASKPAPVTTTSPAPTLPPKPAQSKPQPVPPTPSYLPLSTISCSFQSLWRSVNSMTETRILFSNRTSQTVKIWELNFVGNQDYRGDVASGEQVLVDTYVTHPWLVTDSGGNCRGVYSPKNQPGIVVIE